MTAHWALALILCFTLAAPAHAERTDGWGTLAAPVKAERLRGLADGWRGAAAELALSDPLRARSLTSQADAIRALQPKLVAALDAFYADTRHVAVPLHRAARFCLAQLRGEPEAGRWLAVTAGLPRLGPEGGQIPVGKLASPYVKDPTFVDDGRPVGAHRYIAYGDLFGFYLKPFEVAAPGKGPMLRFTASQTAIALTLPDGADAAWAPDLRVVGDRMVLLYCAGRMVKDLKWPTFRLRMATAPLARFRQEAEAGQRVHFDDAGAVATDARPFGPDDTDFGTIDPHWYRGPHGESLLTYTVVHYGKSGVRRHEEAVWQRPVDPRDPRRATGPDQLIYQGFAGTADDGVAEAQDVLAVGDRAFVFISSRAGDQDQRLLIAQAPLTLGTLPAGALAPLVDPGGAAWKSNAVGSSGAAMIGGRMVMVHQGMDRAGRFTLGWTTLIWDGEMN